ncbi:MAG: 50S ribosomal protein L23 [Thiotrichaceae bacterium]|nr:50S ribosomal protein L23 [Thiotrichaceae bacterium]
MSVLIKPIVTEKMTDLGEKENKFGFIVDKQANKIQIKIAIEEMYDVSVVNINTMRCGGKAKSRFSRTGVIQGKSAAYKKAIVSLAEGENIDFYSNI